MLKIIFLTVKATMLITLVLVLGQITVGQKSISNHVHDFVSHPKIQAPIHWIAVRIDHTAGHAPANDEKNETNGVIRKNGSSLRKRANADNSNGQERLSGLLKRSEE